MKYSKHISLYPLIVSLFIVCLLPLIMSASAPAGEVYMWIDEKGIRHITDQPPDKPAKIIDKSSFKKDSQEEIRRYEEEQRMRRLQDDQETELQKRQQNLKEEIKKSKEQFKESQREAELRSAKEDYEYWKPKLERYKYYLNNSHGEGNRLFWKERVEDIEKKRRKVDELERNR